MLLNSKDDIRNDLLSLSHHLGEETRDYVIIGEGNTSARIDPQTFFVKASGRNLATLDASGLVEIRQARVLELLSAHATDEDVTQALMEACLAGSAGARPSVETILHAVLYQLTGANFIGHTHAVAVNAILCSQHAADIIRHLMPDEIVVCGPNAIYVPYADPGLPLARQVQELVVAFNEQHARSPRVIYLQNHGLFALGQTARQVENITAMAVKHARVLAASYALGGPHWLEESDIARIHSRPDEEIRRVQFK
jgi:rhamnose utilization protein RhaD (predicted bifunctional aldolase and dehydrogenase)